jgi:hypothetical protein
MIIILYLCAVVQKYKYMAVYQIRINEKMSLGKSLVAYLQSIPQIVTFEKSIEKQASKSDVYMSLDRAFADVRLMMDGKKRKKTLDELINELRNSND